MHPRGCGCQLFFHRGVAERPENPPQPRWRAEERPGTPPAVTAGAFAGVAKAPTVESAGGKGRSPLKPPSEGVRTWDRGSWRSAASGAGGPGQSPPGGSMRSRRFWSARGCPRIDEGNGGRHSSTAAAFATFPAPAAASSVWIAATGSPRRRASAPERASSGLPGARARGCCARVRAGARAGSFPQSCQRPRRTDEAVRLRDQLRLARQDRTHRADG